MTLPQTDYRVVDISKVSVVFVDLKEGFLSWLKDYDSRLGRYHHQYCDEEDLVVLIPSISGFSTSEEIRRFYDALKPKMLRDQLTRFGVPVEDFDPGVSVASFDVFCSMRLREFCTLMSELG